MDILALDVTIKRDETGAVKQTIEQLTQLDGTAKKVTTTFKDATGKVTESFEKISRSAKREVADTKAEVQGLERVVADMRQGFASGLGVDSLFTGIAQGIGQRLASLAAIPFQALRAGFELVKDVISESVRASIEYESAFAGVRKTVSASEPELQKLARGFRDLSRELPVSAVELAKIGEAAGQLGVRTELIMGFTKTMAQLGMTTDLSAGQAADQLARFNNIVSQGKDDFERLGSTIVALGNNSAATESEIVSMGLRIAGAGEQLNMSRADILGYATALSSVGIEAEAGGSAISKIFIDIQEATSKGGASLDLFARVAGKSAADFKTAFSKDAAGAVRDFIEGLGRVKAGGGDVLGILRNLGIEEVRQRDALLRLAGSGTVLSDALAVAAKGWADNNALQKESEQRIATTAAQWELLKGDLTDAAIELGSALAPAILLVIDKLRDLAPAIMEASAWFKLHADDITNVAASLLSLGSDVLTGAKQAWDAWSASLERTAKSPIGQFVAAVAEKVAFLEGVMLSMGDTAQRVEGQILSMIGQVTGPGGQMAAAIIGKLNDWRLAGAQAKRETAPAVPDRWGAMGKPPELTLPGGPTTQELQRDMAALLGITNQTTVSEKEAAKAKREHEQATRALAGSMKSYFDELARKRANREGADSLLGAGTEDAQIELRRLGDQITRGGGTAALSAKQFDELGKKIRDLATAAGVTDFSTLYGDLGKAGDEALAAYESSLAQLAEASARFMTGDLSSLEDMVASWGQAGDAVDAYNTQLSGASDASALREVGKEVDVLTTKVYTLTKGWGLIGAGDQRAKAEKWVEEQKAGIVSAEAWKKAQLEALDMARDRGDLTAAQYDKIKKAIEETKTETVNWSDAIQGVVALMEALGISSDSAFGKIMGSIAGAAAAFQNLGERMKLGGGGLGGIFKDKDSKTGLGSILGGITSVLGGAAAAISVGKAIFGLFHKSPAEKAAEEAGKYVGGKLSKSMGEAILKTSKDLGVSIKQATALNLSGIMSEQGKSVTAYKAQVAELFALMRQGGPVAAKAIEEIGSAFSKVKQEAEGGDKAARRMMLEMIQQARAAGQVVPEIQDAVRAGLDKAISGLGAMLKGIPLADEKDVEDQAVLIASTFWAKVKEDGLVAAALAFGEIMDTWKKQLEESGLELSEATAAMLAPIMEVAALAADETTRPLLEGIQGARDMLNGLAEAGYMTTGAFAALGGQAQSAFDALIAQGVSEQSALLAIAPLLADLKHWSEAYGVSLDENTQRLIEQAEAAGVAFPTDPLLQVVDLLAEMVQIMGGELPASVRKSMQAFDALGREAVQSGHEAHEAWANFGGPGPGPDGAQGNGVLGNAAGDVVMPRTGGTLRRIGEGNQAELVAPVRSFADYLVGQIAGTLGSGQAATPARGMAQDRLPIVINMDGRKVAEVLFDLERRKQVKR